MNLEVIDIYNNLLNCGLTRAVADAYASENFCGGRTAVNKEKATPPKWKGFAKENRKR